MRRFFWLNFRYYSLVRHYFRRRLTKAGMLVLSACVLSAVLGLNTYRALVYQIFTFLVSLLLFSFLWTRFFSVRISAERFLPRFATAGKEISYPIVIRSLSKKMQSGLCAAEEFADPRPDFETFVNTPEPGENFRNIADRFMGFYRWEWLLSRKEPSGAAYRQLPVLAPLGEVHLHAEIIPRHRGILHFRGIILARPDPFGLFHACRFFPLPGSLTVLPPRYDLPQFRLPGTRRHQSGGIALISSVGDSEEFISLRDYRPGDPLRRIHWKSWAKTGKPIVREFQGEYFVRHALILDTFQKEEYSEVFEEAVAVAASFACTVRTQESLLDLMFVGTETVCITSGRGLGHSDKTLEVLAALRPCRDGEFARLASSVLERAGVLSGCICVLLKWDEERRNFIAHLRAKGLPVLVLVIVSPPESGHSEPDTGPMSDQPDFFHVLEVGRIAEGLAGLPVREYE
ncbi:MAG: DUF58 domain-containing protein [Desulfobacterales bacterium]